MEHKLLYFHEANAQRKIPEIQKLANLLESSNSPRYQDALRFTYLINNIYLRFFYFLKIVVGDNVSEILSLKEEEGGEISHYAIVRDGKKINSIKLDSVGLTKIIEIIAPERDLLGTGFSIAFCDVVNEEKERVG